ncbi:ArsR family transcriptional regulator [Nocardia zapadnayensis]|nr:ArsR family transcriptional regulator [Nocardia zapadnayensis]MCX0275258.1 ArsR family transcriptional regulator [Nocardia zapadnayensis]
MSRPLARYGGDPGRVGLSQPGVSQHLRVLRDSGFASVRAGFTRAH